MVYCLFWMVTNNNFAVNGNKLTRVENRYIPSYFFTSVKVCLPLSLHASAFLLLILQYSGIFQ